MYIYNTLLLKMGTHLIQPALVAIGYQGTSAASNITAPVVQKRPPASPACSHARVPVVAGQTPIKSPEQKKTKVVHGGSERVNAHVEDMLAKSESPMAPYMNLTDDMLDRELPEPKSLEKAFENAVDGKPPHDLDDGHAPCL